MIDSNNKRSSKTTLKHSSLIVSASTLLLLVLASQESNVGAEKVPSGFLSYPQYNSMESEIDGISQEEANDDIDYNGPVSYEELIEPKPCKGFVCPFQETCGEAELNELSSEDGGEAELVVVANDEKAIYGEWPSYAKVWNDNFLCGGVLITNRHILTAAHCVNNENASSLKVMLGEHDELSEDDYEQTVAVESICVSRYYKIIGSRVIHDYAVLTLKNEVQFNDHVQPACLPYKYKPIGERMMNATAIKPKCFVVGLGMNGLEGATVVQKTPMRQVNCSELKNVRDDDRSRHCFRKEEGVGGDCYGDSGGPLLCLNPETKRWTVTGIVSYGIVGDIRGHCDSDDISPGMMSAFTRVPALLDVLHANCGI